MICEAGDITLVPFPFVDLPVARRRPALVVSGRRFNEAEHQSILAMITTASGSSWISDTPLRDLSSAGLRTPCVVRMKLFTLENRLIERRLGVLSESDRTAVRQAMHSALDV